MYFLFLGLRNGDRVAALFGYEVDRRLTTCGWIRVLDRRPSQFQIGTVTVTYCQNLPLTPARFATLKVGPNKALKATEHHSVAFLIAKSFDKTFLAATYLE
jgi:hypothetical protein